MPTILIVEDNDAFRAMLQLKLTHMGYAVRQARNGHEALDMYQREPADLIITDLIMPEKEGLETIQELKRRHPGVKIIAMSGGGANNPGNYLKLARRFGALRALAKPFSNEELATAITEVLREAE